MLTRVRVPGAARDFCPRVNVQCRLSYGVCAAPMSKCTHQNLCACSNSQTLAATPLSGCMTIFHTPTEWVALLLWLLRLTLGRWEVLGRKNRVSRGEKKTPEQSKHSQTADLNDITDKAHGVRQGLLLIMWVFSPTVGAAAKSEPSPVPSLQLPKTERCTWLLKMEAFVHHNESDYS